MNLLLLIGLILLNGLFAMAELALVSARRSRLQKLADEGDNGAATAITLGEDPTRFLSTVQIGITAIGILNGIVGEAALAGPLGEILRQTGLSKTASSATATLTVVAGITYLTIVLGELVPKRIAQIWPEGTARLMARPVAALAMISRPFVFLLSKSTDALVALFKRPGGGEGQVTEEDIRAAITEGAESGNIAPQEENMLHNVFQLDDRPIGSMMTPRSEIIAYDLDQPLETNLKRITASDHSRFPLCRGSMDQVAGTIGAKRLLRYAFEESHDQSLEELASPPVFLPEGMNGLNLLEQFREADFEMVFAVNEFGEVEGIVTLRNLLEALAGEFCRPEGSMPAYQRIDDDQWIFDATLPMAKLQECLQLSELPESAGTRFHTLGGLLMWLLEKVPQRGDLAAFQNWQFEVLEVQGYRLRRVRATKLPAIDPES